MTPEETGIFDAVRPHLMGLAYRILGSRADAEDAVQDTFVKWAQADREGIDNVDAWLATACTRRCLDLLRAAHRKRVDYVGAWLPEPIQTSVESPAERGLELAASLTTAFLLVLERLTPKERAAYLLHDIFEAPYAQVAETLELRESACRQLVSRARAHVARAKVRQATPPARQEQLLAAFQAAVTEGRTEALAALLAADVRLTADGGGKVPAILDVLRGKDRVTAFLTQSLRGYWAGHAWLAVDINGGRGIRIVRDGETAAVVSFGYDETGALRDIYIVRNPDKLAGFGTVAIH